MTSAAPPPLPTAAGMGLAGLSFALFSLMDILLKGLSGTYPLFEVAFLSALFALPTIVGLGVVLGGRHRLRQALRTPQRRLHLMRAALGMAGGYCALYAYRTLPLAEAYALAFAAPLFITALSRPVLGETVGWRRWSAVALGFLGVLIMLHPGGGGVLCLGAASALGGAFLYSVSVTLVRRMGSRECSLSFALFGCASNLTVSALLMLPDFILPSAADLGQAAACGILGGTATICLMTSFHRAPPAVVAPFQYTQLLWGTLAGYLLWDRTPDLWLCLGGSIMIVSGMGNFYLEAVSPPPDARLKPKTVTAIRRPETALG